MEAILAFFNTLKATLIRANNWLAAKLDAAFYSLGVKLFGQERIDPFLKNTRARYRSVQQFWASTVDKNTAYYKPISRLWKIFGWGFFLAVFYIFCVETNFLWLMGSMPSVEDLQNPKVNQSSEIYTSDGIMIGKFYTENRTPVGYDEISPNLTKALIATEDERFYDHSGIDLRAMARVAAGLLTGDTDQGGGSTVTQQLAKKLFKTRRRDARGLLGGIPVLGTLVFKTKEWLTAIKLERNFTKEEIITMYLNTVDYGNNAYGINTAARSYFSKSPDSLNVQEAAVLVGLQKATTTYNPIRNPDRSLERRNVVLDRMANFNYLTRAEADSISQLPIELKVKFETPYDGNANYFKNAVVDYVKKWGEENGYDLYTDGLKIYTTIDSRMQEHAEKALETKMRDLQKTFEEHWGREKPWRDEDGKEIPNFLQDVIKRTGRYKSLAARFPNQPDSIDFYLNKKDTMTVYDWKTGGSMVRVWSSMDSLEYYKRIMRAGMMAMEPQTGYIKAWVGGLDYNFFKYDHVKQGKRQPGSTFKPFVYTAAIDDTTFDMTPCDRIVDKPYVREMMINGKMQRWAPRNSNGYFTYSNMTLRRALAQSVNSVTVQLTEKVGPKDVVRYAEKMGISTPLRAEMGIGLGIFDVSLYDMVAAYSIFVNSGTYTTPVLVTRIEDQRGSVIEEFVPERHQAIRPESAFLMRHMLKGGIEEPGGTSRGLYNFTGVVTNKGEIGGKTGTTSNNSDGWYMCITPDLVMGAWVGGDDRSIHFRSTNLGQGSRMALPIVGSFLENVYKDKSLDVKPRPFSQPMVKIEKEYQCSYPVYEPDTLEFEPEEEPFLPDEISPSSTPLIGPPPPPLPTPSVDSVKKRIQ